MSDREDALQALGVLQTPKSSNKHDSRELQIPLGWSLAPTSSLSKTLGLLNTPTNLKRKASYPSEGLLASLNKEALCAGEGSAFKKYQASGEKDLLTDLVIRRATTL